MKYSLERMTLGTPALATKNKQNIILQYDINMSINTINSVIALEIKQLYTCTCI